MQIEGPEKSFARRRAKHEGAMPSLDNRFFADSGIQQAGEKTLRAFEFVVGVADQFTFPRS
jgi:hypothetical protein